MNIETLRIFLQDKNIMAVSQNTNISYAILNRFANGFQASIKAEDFIKLQNYYDMSKNNG